MNRDTWRIMNERTTVCSQSSWMAAMNSWFISPQNVYDTYSYIFFLPKIGFSCNCCFVACFSCTDCISDLPR